MYPSRFFFFAKEGEIGYYEEESTLLTNVYAPVETIHEDEQNRAEG